MFRIGEFSKMSKTTVKALRYYDEVGLLKPEITDKFTGYRLYSSQQLLELHKIQSYRQAGLSINEIFLILSGENEKKILEQRKQELLSEMTEQKLRLSRIEFILTGHKEENFMNYQATIKQSPQCIVYCAKETIKSFDKIHDLITESQKKVSEKYPDLKKAKPEYCFTAYLDNEYKETDIRIEYVQSVTEKKKDFDNIIFRNLESVTVASILHKGPYRNFAEAYNFIYRWISSNDYIPVGSARECYIDGEWNKKSEDDYLTEIQIPVVRKSEVSDKYKDTKEYKESETKNYTDSEKKDILKAGDKIIEKFAQIRTTSPDSEEARALVKEWQDHITKYYYKCSNEILSSLAKMYTADVRFKDNMDRFGEGTAEFISKAIDIYCN